MKSTTPNRARRAFLVAAAGVAIMPRIASAQVAFPNKPITLITPTPSGGSSDIMARALARAASARLGQPIQVENRPGASQTLGPLAIARARPDGYLLSQMHASSVRQAILSKLPMSVPDDFTPLIQTTAFVLGAAVQAQRFPGGWQDFVAEARRNPGRMSYGTTGVNGGPHVGMEALALREGIQLNHIPFRGESDGLQALLGGHIDAMAATTGLGVAVDSGRARWLHLWAEQRHARWPDTPTLTELGYAGVVPDLTIGIVAPARLDPAVARRLEEAFTEAAHDPAHLAALANMDMKLIFKGSTEYTAYLRNAVRAEHELIQRLHLHAD